jgi:hypothetical protein
MPSPLSRYLYILSTVRDAAARAALSMRATTPADKGSRSRCHGSARSRLKPLLQKTGNGDRRIVRLEFLRP